MDATTKMHRLRLAVGIFRDAASLQNALQMLRDDGFATDRLTILAGREALDKLGWPLTETVGFGRCRPEIRSFKEIDLPGCAKPVLVSDGDVAQLLADWTNWAERRFCCLLDPWLGHAHACVLQRQLDGGAATLWVRVEDGDQELRTCRILLRTSADHVQVHDIARIRR